ncbi:MAG: hypothetical protein ACOY3O_06035 [Thermodesulfobacteriota bacterium]
MRHSFFRAAVVAAAIMGTVTVADAATKGRIIPDGMVTLQKKGAVTTFKEQTVLDENALIACEGTCLVKLQGISLIAVDQSKFAVKESGDQLNLYVAEGRVQFVVADQAQSFAFYTPDHRFVKSEGFIAPAASEQSVKGFVNVNADNAFEIGMEQGGMIVLTDEGSQTINAGQSIILAQADVPSNSEPTGKKEESDDGDKGFFAFWSSLGTGGQVALVGAGLVAGGWIASETFLDDDDDKPAANVAPPPPEEPPTRNPSPNR